MKFRTEIESIKGTFEIDHDKKIVLLGSCFADNVGRRLEADGFDVVHNPLGPLFNPESIARIISRDGKAYGKEDFYEYDGTFHCLDFANRYQSPSAEELAEKVNADYLPLADALEQADVLFVTFGTNKVYRLAGTAVGNCHKLPGKIFDEHNLTVGEIADIFSRMRLPQHTVVTLSPVRYPGEGLAKGFLSKATLRLALDKICDLRGTDYFPSFEIVNDDLRDYRFYTDDLRHPTDFAVDYIYNHFSNAYFSEATRQKALECRKETLRRAHRQIISEEPVRH